jgi:flagellar FliL protein
MSSEAKDQAPKSKGKGMMMKIVAALALVGVGGGGAFALVQSGMMPGTHKQEAEDNHPKLVRKGEEDPYAPPAAEGGEGGGAAEVDGDGGSKYRTSYYTFSDDFTSNLKNSSGLIQVSLAASTHRDGRVMMWLKKHELAARSAILVVLADTPEEEVLTPEGKEHLQKRITAAINKVLTDAEGFGGVDAVYFKSLLVQ